MVSPLKQSLPDLCGIRIAYMMWTRQNVTKNCVIEVLFDELVDVVLADVEKLPLPKKLKPHVLQHVKPTGKHLLSIVSLWLSNKLPDDSREWLTNHMLYECLIVNPYGLINQRKTAEKLLGSRMLHNWFAFRLACMNFLETEVLKLWIHVKEYFLNKIMLEGVAANVIIDQKRDSLDLTNTSVDLTGHYYSNYIRKYPSAEDSSIEHPFPFTTEPDEVLFWIAYCLTKENGISIEDIPHYLGDDVKWHEFSMELAGFSGNVAYFDYLKNFRNIEYDFVKFSGDVLFSVEEYRIQPCFLFNFLQLNSGEKATVINECEEEILTQFLQWPLSLTSMVDPEGLWDVLTNMQKKEIFHEIFYVLFNENIFLHSERHRNDDCGPYNYYFDTIPIIPGSYNREHLVELWVDLWKISSNIYKVYFLKSFIFKIIEDSRRQKKFLERFKTSGLRDRMLKLFLSNGEAVLELFERENLKESLRFIVAKHMPESVEELDRRCISLLETPTEQPEDIRKEMVQARNRILCSMGRNTGLSIVVYPNHYKFLNYIQEVLFSWS